MLIPSSTTSSKFTDGVSDQFPAGLRVLVVDDDPLCLTILEKMLRKCLYEVTKCNRAEIALKYLRDNKNGIDIVISDVHMPDMDGFKLLEQVGLEMDLPVIMMSADDSKNVVMKGVTHGACDYLIKPVSIEALKNIWQHVIRKTKHELKDKDFGLNGSVEDGERKQKSEEDVDNSTMENEENCKNSKKRKDEEDEDDDDDEDEEKDDTSASKKPRVVWSRELHLQFLAAVDHLGYEKAVPKRILEVMNVPGLTRENVASHLQKYRICLRKKYGGVSQQQNGLNSPYMGQPDANFGSISSFHGSDFQALRQPSNQFPGLSLATLQSLVRPSNKSPISVMDQRNTLLSFESPVEQKFGSNVGQMSLLHHGIRTNIESNQMTNLSGMNVQMNPKNSPLIVPVTQPVSRALQPIFLNGISNVGLTHSGTLYPQTRSIAPSMVDFSFNGNIFPNAKASNGFVNGCGYLDELQQYKTTRGFQTVGSTIDASHHAPLQGTVELRPSSFVQPGYSSVQTNGQGAFFSHSTEGGQNGNSNLGLPLNNPLMADRCPSVKAEIFQDASCPSNLFSPQYCSDDILSELLKPQDDIGSFETGFGFDEYLSDNLLA